MEFPLGSVWLPSSVKTFSGVLYCCVDRNIFPEKFSVSPDTEVPMKLMVSKSSSRMDCPALTGGLCFTGTCTVSIFWPIHAHQVEPDLVDWFTLSWGLSGRISLLHSAHPSETSFSWPLPLLPAFIRREDLDFNTHLSASFLLPWVMLLFFLFC